MKTAIEIGGLSKRFGDTQALRDLELSVETSTVFGLIGPNGAGKTTTLRVLLGMIRPDAGRVSVLGLDPRTNSRQIRSMIGVVLDTDGLYDRSSAYFNLDFYARIWHIPSKERKARIEGTLRSFDLWKRKHEPVMKWSKGMRQKLAVARALIHRPPLLFLDEPFSGLDPIAAVELRNHIKGLARDQGVTVVLTTHDLSHVERVCDRVTVIEGGRAIASGAPESIGDRGEIVEVCVNGQGLSEGILQDMQRCELLVAFQLLEASAQFTCPRVNVPRLVTEFTRRGVTVEELHTVRNSLEDAFLHLFSQRRSAANE